MPIGKEIKGLIHEMSLAGVSKDNLPIPSIITKRLTGIYKESLKVKLYGVSTPDHTSSIGLYVLQAYRPMKNTANYEKYMNAESTLRDIVKNNVKAVREKILNSDSINISKAQYGNMHDHALSMRYYTVMCRAFSLVAGSGYFYKYILIKVSTAADMASIVNQGIVPGDILDSICDTRAFKVAWRKAAKENGLPHLRLFDTRPSFNENVRQLVKILCNIKLKAILQRRMSAIYDIEKVHQ